MVYRGFHLTLSAALSDSYIRVVLPLTRILQTCGKRSITVTMEFESDILGEFSESFRFALRGNEEPVPCQFKGHVVSFDFRCLSR